MLLIAEPTPTNDATSNRSAEAGRPNAAAACASGKIGRSRSSSRSTSRYFGGQTCDISSTGLRIELPANMPVVQGKVISIHVGLNDRGQALANRRGMIPPRSSGSTARRGGGQAAAADGGRSSSSPASRPTSTRPKTVHSRSVVRPRGVRPLQDSQRTGIHEDVCPSFVERIAGREAYYRGAGNLCLVSAAPNIDSARSFNIRNGRSRM